MNYCFSRSNLSQSHDALHTNAHASFLSLFPLHDSRVTSKASFLSFFLSILFTSGPDPLHEFCPILSYYPFSFSFFFFFNFILNILRGIFLKFSQITQSHWKLKIPREFLSISLERDYS